MFQSLFLLSALFIGQSYTAPAFDAWAYCQSQWSQLQFYADPNNCTNFIECNYVQQTATIISCPPNTFWRQSLLTCLPEGPTPCQDLCTNATVAAKPCYASSTNCNTFYICANTVSYKYCCPAGLEINPTTCQCVVPLSGSCNDVCQGTATTLAPATSTTTSTTTAKTAPGGGCIDKYGNHLATVPDNPEQFRLYVGSSSVYFTMTCPLGTIFDVQLCNCDFPPTTTPPPTTTIPWHVCSLWLPFDGDTKDHSANRHVTQLNGNAFLDNSIGADATGQGNGSLSTINGGFLQIPGLAGTSLGSQASFCVFFRCPQTSPNSNKPYACVSTGGILANDNAAARESFSIVIAVKATNKAIYELNLWRPAGVAMYLVPITVPANGWNQLCVIFDGPNTVVSIYVNNVRVNAQPTQGAISIGSQAFNVGWDYVYGNFLGNIDNVLICPHVLTAAEITAHYTGNYTYLASIGDIS